MRDGEGAPKGAPDDLDRSVAPASEAAPLTAEYRGGPLTTIRLVLDAYVRDDPAWSTITPSRPDDEPPASDPGANEDGDQE